MQGCGRGTFRLEFSYRRGRLTGILVYHFRFYKVRIGIVRASWAPGLPDLTASRRVGAKSRFRPVQTWD